MIIWEILLFLISDSTTKKSFFDQVVSRTTIERASVQTIFCDSSKIDQLSA